MNQVTLDKLKKMYEMGTLKKTQIDDMYNAGKLTYDEYKYVLGEIN